LIFPIIFLLPLDSHVEGFMASLAFALSVLLSIGFLFIPKAMELLSSDYDDNALRIKMFNGNFKKKIDPLPRWTTVGGGGDGGGGGGIVRANISGLNEYLPVFLSRFHQRITPAASRNISHSPQGDMIGNGTGNGGAIANRNGRKGNGNGKGNGGGMGGTLFRDNRNIGVGVGGGNDNCRTIGGVGGKKAAMIIDGGIIEEGDEDAEEEGEGGEGDHHYHHLTGGVGARAKEPQQQQQWENSKRLLSVAEFYKTKDLDTRMRVSVI
jgi:hypothetical protein